MLVLLGWHPSLVWYSLGISKIKMGSHGEISNDIPRIYLTSTISHRWWMSWAIHEDHMGDITPTDPTQRHQTRRFCWEDHRRKSWMFSARHVWLMVDSRETTGQIGIHGRIIDKCREGLLRIIFGWFKGNVRCRRDRFLVPIFPPASFSQFLGIKQRAFFSSATNTGWLMVVARKLQVLMLKRNTNKSLHKWCKINLTLESSCFCWRSVFLLPTDTWGLGMVKGKSLTS